MALPNDAMHKHPVPGRTIRKAGQVLRLADLEGKQVPDVVCFNARDHGE